jgi:thiol-disulfide isomerase/thioredoxin
MNRAIIYKIILGFAVCAMTVGIALYFRPITSTGDLKASFENLKILNDQSRPLAIGELEDRPFVILHFWASWCGPCRKELPSLFKALPQLSGKFLVLLVSTDDQPAAAVDFLKTLDTAPPDQSHIVWDENHNLSHTFAVKLMPETYVLDRSGRTIREISGLMDWQDPKNLKFFRELK